MYPTKYGIIGYSIKGTTVRTKYRNIILFINFRLLFSLPVCINIRVTATQHYLTTLTYMYSLCDTRVVVCLYNFSFHVFIHLVSGKPPGRAMKAFPPGGGGYSVCKRVPTAVRPLESGGCRDLQGLKKKGGGVLILYCKIGELSEQYFISNN